MVSIVSAFNQEKALVGAFSVITNLWMELFEAPMTKHSTTMLDYNEEARKLFATLDGTKPSRFNNLDPIYRSDAGGFIYVGGDLVTHQQPRVPQL